MKKKKYYKKKIECLKLRKYLLLFTTILIFVVPLIVFFKKVEVPESGVFLYGPTNYVADFFAYYKARILQYGALVIFTLTIYIKWKESKASLKPDFFEGLLIAFASAVFLSYLFSEYKEAAWDGWLERFEGTATWLSYIALSYSVHTLVQTKKEAKLLISSFVLSSLLISIIGFFQYKGIDLFQTEIGKRLILGSDYKQLGENLNFTFEKGRVYGTLYNPNYIGSLVALAFPLGLYMISELKSWLMRILMTVTLILHVVILVGSRSTAGFVAVAVSILVFTIMFFLQKKKSKSILIISGLIIIAMLVSIIQTNFFQSQYNKLKNNITNTEAEYNPFTKVEYDHPILTVHIDNGEKYHIKPVGYDVEVFDKEWNLLEKQELENQHRFRHITDYDFLIDKIHRTGRVIIRVLNNELEKGQWMEFDLVHPDQFSLGYNLFTDDNMNIDVIKVIPSERLLSSRGYIWNRLLPRILDKPLFGNGADTFVLNFPHLDLKGRAVAMKVAVVDKPHNTYIQVFYNFGFIGGLLFLIMISSTVFKYRRSLLLASVIGWLIVGIANDSVVFVTFMFFCIMSLSHLFNTKGEVVG